MNVKNGLSHDEDDEEVVEMHPQIAMPTQGQQGTPLRINESASPSTPQGGNSSASSSTCTPSERGKKFKNLSDIYDEGMNSLFTLFCHVDDPIHFEEEIKDKKWIEAMDEEMNAIERNKTWDLVELPKGKEVIRVKWVYKTKSNAEGKIERHKARLVVKGYKQQYGKDYEETFAPVARTETVRAVLSIAAQNKWKVYQMDVKSAFLNGVLKEEVYFEQPLGYEKKDEEHKVCKLKKALYGLKQAPRAWYNRIDSYLLDNEFDKCEEESTVYIKEKDGKILIVVLYVDHAIFTGNDDQLIKNFKSVMKEEFEMTDMGFLRYFLRIEVDENEKGIFISQARYVNQVLSRFNMQECKASITPTVMGLKLSREDSSKDFDPSLYKSIVGSLMYLTTTRPNIMYAVSLISRFMERPKEAHCDWDGSVDDRKNTSGYVFHMGSGAISWDFKEQSIVALSIAEAEYVVATAEACQAVWMRRMLRSLSQE
eukprot:PITA_13960